MEDPYVLDENQRCTVRRYQRAEEHIAQFLSRLTHVREYVPTALDPDLDNTQREAVHMALTQPVSILCGGAGVGKSRTLAAIVDQLGPNVLVCAPTGKAAARLRELGIDAFTLHSAIYKKGDFTFTHLVLMNKACKTSTYSHPSYGNTIPLKVFSLWRSIPTTVRRSRCTLKRSHTMQTHSCHAPNNHLPQ